GRLVAVGVEAGAEAGFVEALGVVVLVPEDREDDHRLAGVEGLGDGVVATVGDHQVDLGGGLGVGGGIGGGRVVGEVVRGWLGAFGDDHPVAVAGEGFDQVAHQVDVGGAE